MKCRQSTLHATLSLMTLTPCKCMKLGLSLADPAFRQGAQIFLIIMDYPLAAILAVKIPRYMIVKLLLEGNSVFRV